MREHCASHPITDVGEWQGQRGGETSRTFELEQVSFRARIPESVHDLQTGLRPNLPWAEDHFGERVGGEPLNPPPSSSYWPHTVRGHVEHVDADGKFSHTYPERLWPRFADRVDKPNLGIRYNLGDLNDVIELLVQRPGTRQAYIPIWFPEDTGASDAQRVPCTLGYHAMIRHDRLYLTYYIRSCDLLRHFNDDVYMAMRLAQWLTQRVNEHRALPNRLVPGELTMHISSLHIFEADRQVLDYRFQVLTRKRADFCG